MWVWSDFEADALRHEGYPCFEASLAPHSRVEGRARVRPAGALPHLPRVQRTGHTREWDLLDPDRRPETLNTDRAGLAQCRMRTHAMERVGISCMVPPVLATVRLNISMNIPGARSPMLLP